MSFDVGAWLADQLHVPAAELEVVGRPIAGFEGDQVVTYTRAGTFAARVILGAPARRPLLPQGQHRFRTLRAHWFGGSASVLVSSDEDLGW